MKNLLRNTLLCHLAMLAGTVLGIAGPAAAHAAGPAAGVQALAEIESAAIAAVLPQLPPTAQASAAGMDTRLRLAACSEPLQAQPASVRAGAASVAVRCAQPAWTVYVALRISDLRPVAVLARPTERGAVLDASAVQWLEKDVGQLPFGYVDDSAQLAGLQARRALSAGHVLSPTDLAAPRWVARGQIVHLVGRSGGLQVQASGEALDDASEGQSVRVRNSSSRRIVDGTAIAPGVVAVRLQ